MKTLMLAIVAVALVGCNQGGTGDQYDTDTGTGYDATNSIPSRSPSQADTNNVGDTLNQGSPSGQP